MLLIPIGLDQDEVRRTPWITYGIIAANVAVFLLEWASVAGGGSPLTSWGYIPAQPDVVRLFTSMFLHVGLLHLAGNMLFFFVTGPFVEDAFGRVLFLLLYLSSGAAAGWIHAAMNPDSLAPLVGASGAIAGVMGAFLVRLAGRRIRFFWVPLPPLPFGSRQVSIPAFVFLPLWFLGQLLFASLEPSRGGGVAFWAHVGGFALGCLAALLIGITGIERRFIHPAIEAQIGYRADDEFLRAIEEGQRGNLEEAGRLANQILARKPRDVDARRYAYEIALQADNREEIAQHATRLLDLYVDSGENDLARRLIREAGEAASSELPARFLLRAGDFLTRQGERQKAREHYRRLFERFPADAVCLRAMLQSAELDRQDGNPGAGRRSLENGLAHPACTGQWRKLFEGKLAEVDRAIASPSPGYRGSPPASR